MDIRAEWVPRGDSGAMRWHAHDNVAWDGSSSSEGQVITDSVYALMQGMFPANPAAATISLANGTNVTSPLGGYVYIPIQ